MKVVLAGNVIDGLSIYGPFDDDDDPILDDFLEMELDDVEWVIASVTDPGDV